MAHAPNAELYPQVILSLIVSCPNAALIDPTVFSLIANCPNAELKIHVVFLERTRLPTTVL